MRKIPVTQLKAGMAFSKPVYLDPDNMLVGANEPLSVTDLERLKKWNIKEVETSGEPVEVEMPKDPRLPDEGGSNPNEIADIEKVITFLKATVKNREKFRDLLTESEAAVKEAYIYLNDEKPYQLSKLRTVAEKISAMIDDSPNCFFYLYYVDLNSDLAQHVSVTAFFGGILANALEFSKPRVIELIFSILLMKVGMLKVPKDIRDKTGQLTEAERNALHTHPVLSYQILTQTAKVKNSIAIVALQHTEYYDGSGYPRQIKGAEINEYARIAAITDSFAALLERKSYRKEKLPYEAMKELVTLGVYRYDPVYLKAFLNRLSIYPIGSVVKISDNSTGIVVGSVAAKPMRPIIMLVRDTADNRITQPSFLHLLYQNNKYISAALDPTQLKMDFETELYSLVKVL